jgi:hypothetical protein
MMINNTFNIQPMIILWLSYEELFVGREATLHTINKMSPQSQYSSNGDNMSIEHTHYSTI